MARRKRSTVSAATADRSLLFGPVDVASMAVFRIAFGGLMLWEVGRFIWNGWIAADFVAPRFHFTFPGFEWVRPWPAVGMYLHFFVVAVAAALVALGWCYRAGILVLWLAWTHIFLLERTLFLNHQYLICLLAFLLMPAFGEWWLAVAFSWGGFLLDLCVVPLLLWKRTRLWAFGAATLFHLMNATMFYIGVFPWFMMAATTLFLEPDWPRRMLRVLAARRQRHAPQAVARTRRADLSVTDPPPSARRRRLVTMFIALWVTAQVLVPFRHLLIPGQVDWIEEGYPFSWRMMLNDKATLMQITATDPRTKQILPVDPRMYLHSRQIDKMAQDPALLVQFAHFVRDELERAGVAGAEVGALVVCTLNGRRPQLLIDPTVDLARVPKWELHREWIVPLTEPLPKQPFDMPPSEWQRLGLVPDAESAGTR